MQETLFNNKWFDSNLLRTDTDLDGRILRKLEQRFEYFQFTDKLLNENSVSTDSETPALEVNGLHDREFEVDFFQKFSNISYDNNRRVYAEEHAKMKGYVTAINSEFFEAKIFEDGGEDGVYEIAEFDVADVSPDDISLFKEGAVFYWIFGRFFKNRTVKKMSEIRFQRIAPLTSVEFDNLMDKSDEFSDKINWD